MRLEDLLDFPELVDLTRLRLEPFFDFLALTFRDSRDAERLRLEWRRDFLALNFRDLGDPGRLEGRLDFLTLTFRFFSLLTLVRFREGIYYTIEIIC